MPSPLLCAVVLVVYVGVGLLGFALCATAAWADRSSEEELKRRQRR